jgi:hypothetical protein
MSDAHDIKDKVAAAAVTGARASGGYGSFGGHRHWCWSGCWCGACIWRVQVLQEAKAVEQSEYSRHGNLAHGTWVGVLSGSSS